MITDVRVKTVLKRGALVAAANWQVVIIQFLAEVTFKMLLSVPVLGGILLVVLVLGREWPEVFSSDVRESISFVAMALTTEPPALASFVLSFAFVVVAGSGFMFVLKSGTVAVLVAGERDAVAVEEPPLRLEPLWTAARFSVDGYLSACARFMRRFMRLGLLLILIYAVTAAAYLAALVGGPDWLSGDGLGWTAKAGLLSAALVVWITLLNFVYLLVQMTIVIEDCSVRAASRRVAGFLRAEPRLTFGAFGVVLLLVTGATVVSLIATTSLGLIAFVPFAGLAVLPLQVLAWIFRGFVFQYFGLGALGAYIAIYRRHASARASMAPAGPDFAPAPGRG